MAKQVNYLQILIRRVKKMDPHHFIRPIIRYRNYLILLLLIAFFGVYTDNFLSINTVLTILRQTSMIAISSIGVGMVVIAGCVDISTGATMVLATVLCAHMITNCGMPIVLALILTLVLTSFTGILSGTLVVMAKVPSMIVGFFMMTIIKGIANIISKGGSIGLIPNVLGFLAQTSFFGVFPLSVILTIILYAVAAFVLNRTYYGRYLYAAGGNFRAAGLSGINVNLIRWSTFLISGLLSGVAGILMLSRLAIGTTTLYIGFEMDVLCAVIVGGISISGGEGRISDAFVGSLIVGILRTGLYIAGAGQYWRDVIMGGMLAVFVVIDSYQKNVNNKIS